MQLRTVFDKVTYLRVGVHWLFWWPISDSLSFPPPLPLSLPLVFSLPLSVPALFPVVVSVPGSLAVFPSAAVVGGRLGAPLKGKVFLSIPSNLKIKDGRLVLKINIFTLLQCCWNIIELNEMPSTIR